MVIIFIFYETYKIIKRNIWCKDGDVLEMTLDLDQATLSFKVNDEDFGAVFKNIKKRSYDWH